MSGRKARVTVRIYHQFPRKGWETAPNQVTWEQVNKYLSGKPLRFGPERRREDEQHENKEQAGPQPDGEKPSDPGTP